MIPSRIRVVGLVAAAAIIAGACTSSIATASPATPPTATPVVTIGPAATPTPTLAPTPTPAPTQVIVGSVPADQLVVTSRLTICSDLPYPPQEYFDANGDPIGADIEIGAEIATRLGLKEAVQNTVFDTIAAALLAGKCDLIISSYDIRPDRLSQFNMIPYFKSGQAFVVAKGNPENIKASVDLCGKAVGVESGTSELDHLNGTGSYKPAEGLIAQCVAAGKDKIEVKSFAHDSDALLSLQSNKVSAYFTDLPVAAYYVKQQPDLYEVTLNLNPVTQGIAVSKDSSKSQLEAGVKAALESMMADGSYLKILSKYNLEAGALTSTNP